VARAVHRTAGAPVVQPEARSVREGQHNSNTYNDWFLERVFVIVPIQALAARFLQTMQDYPPSQEPARST
jgi:hypothetical protein